LGERERNKKKRQLTYTKGGRQVSEIGRSASLAKGGDLATQSDQKEEYRKWGARGAVFSILCLRRNKISLGVRAH